MSKKKSDFAKQVTLLVMTPCTRAKKLILLINLLAQHLV